MKITHARITAMPTQILDPMPQVMVRVEEGEEVLLFEYYPDEISFQASDFIGLTLQEAHDLKRKKDVNYLQS